MLIYGLILLRYKINYKLNKKIRSLNNLNNKLKDQKYSKLKTLFLLKL